MLAVSPLRQKLLRIYALRWLGSESWERDTTVSAHIINYRSEEDLRIVRS